MFVIAPAALMTELEAAWDEVHGALPAGWVVGRPGLHHESGRWHLYAHDARERPRVGRRSREVLAAGDTEAACVRELARRLRERGATGDER